MGGGYPPRTDRTDPSLTPFKTDRKVIECSFKYEPPSRIQTRRSDSPCRMTKQQHPGSRSLSSSSPSPSSSSALSSSSRSSPPSSEPSSSPSSPSALTTGWPQRSKTAPSAPRSRSLLSSSPSS